MYPRPRSTGHHRRKKAAIVTFLAALAASAVAAASASAAQELHVLAQTSPYRGELNVYGLHHTIRLFGGSWTAFGDVQDAASSAGTPGTVTSVSAADSRRELHVLASARGSDGVTELFHSIRRSDGGWTPFGQVAGQTGRLPSHVVDPGSAVIDGSLHVLAATTSGDLYHAIRRADGSWTHWGNVKLQTGDPGVVARVEAAASGADLHVAVTTAAGGVYHTIRYADGSWTSFGDIEGQSGERGSMFDVATAAIGDELHVVVKSQRSDYSMRLYHAVRHADGSWTTFGDVNTVAGATSNPLKIAAADVNNELHLLVSTWDTLVHSIRHANGTWTQFGDVEEQTGNTSAVWNVAASGVESP
jgi:hypothetical protein